MARDAKEVFAQVTSWLGFACGIWSLIVFFCLMPGVSPRIHCYNDRFIKDFNRESWRLAMFSFIPDVFVDIWTPFLMGMISILCHAEDFDLDWMCKTYAHFFAWNFVMALFGQIGYSGGVGVIASAFTLLCTLFSLICIFLFPDRSAKLNLASGKLRSH